MKLNTRELILVAIDETTEKCWTRRGDEFYARNAEKMHAIRDCDMTDLHRSIRELIALYILEVPSYLQRYWSFDYSARRCASRTFERLFGAAHGRRMFEALLPQTKPFPFRLLQSFKKD